MSIKRLSGAGLTTPKSNKLWDQTTFQSGMFALATVSLTTTATSVVFDNIPSNYTHLQLRITARDNAGSGTPTYIKLTFNSDAGSNYTYHRVFSDGATVYSDGGTGLAQTYINFALANSSTTQIMGASITDVLDYANTSKAKTIRNLGAADQSGSGRVGLASGAWYKNTASVYEAISKVTLVADTGTFGANSHFALYGIKAA